MKQGLGFGVLGLGFRVEGLGLLLLGGSGYLSPHKTGLVSSLIKSSKQVRSRLILVVLSAHEPPSIGE